MLFSRKSESRTERSPAPSTASVRAPIAQPPTGNGTVISADDTPTQSFIDASLTIVGDLHASGDVRLDGRICGNVRCAQLIVGKDAAVTGSVSAEQAIVRGRIVGTIRSPVVIIQSTAHVESEIIYGLLAIDDGAIFEGVVHRRDHPLEEADTAAPLLDLQRAALAAEAPSSTGGERSQIDSDKAVEAEAVAAAPPVANDAPAANGRVPQANGHSPSAT